MPHSGLGALLKWVTSFPGNPTVGLPTVSGLVLLSDASNGMPVAVLEAGAVGAAYRCRRGARCGGAWAPDCRRRVGDRRRRERRAAARTFVARGRDVVVWDVDAGRAERTAEEVGGRARDEALGADVVVTVTPGHSVVFGQGLATRTTRA